MSESDMERLRRLSVSYAVLRLRSLQLAEERDALALSLIDAGATWRDVADAAGFENPYIAALKKKREAAIGREAR